MNRTKRIENAKQLAREIIRVQNKIQNIIDTNQSKFYVFRDEEEGWIVPTYCCQMGGCVISFIPAESEETAKKIAAELTFKGSEPIYNGLCSSCRVELNEMQM